MAPAGHPYHQPTDFLNVLRTLDLIGESRAIGAMLIALIFHGQHELPPAHVEVVLPKPIGAHHRNLRFRSAVARTNQQEPQPGFSRRRRTGVNEAERCLELA